MGSMLHPDIANIDPKNATPEDMERLMSDPLMRSLHYQMTHGVQDIKLETNKGEQKFKNICLPEGADPEEYLQKAMAEDAANKKRAAAEEKRKKDEAHKKKLATSDPWVIDVVGAGTEKVNGRYERDGEAVRNGGRVFKGPNGYSFSYECVSGGASAGTCVNNFCSAVSDGVGELGVGDGASAEVRVEVEAVDGGRRVVGRRLEVVGQLFRFASRRALHRQGAPRCRS